METRKVQISGGSTYIISLPKKWARKIGISPGATLNISEDRNGNLIISPTSHVSKEAISGEIRLSGKEGPEAIMRRLVGAYVSGVTSLVVTSNGSIPPELARVVREFTRLVMGVEIVEERKDLIKLQDLIDPADFSLRTGLKRMAYITEKMVEDSLVGLEDPKNEILDDVALRDMEVDRINWLIHKEYNMFLNYPRISEKANVTTEDALNYMITSRIVERVADHAVAMTRHLQMVESFESPSLVRSIHQEGLKSKKIFTDSIISLLSKDLDLADSVIDAARDQSSYLQPLMKKVFRLPSDEAVILANVLNSMERIGAYGADIGKITLNTFIRSKKAV